MQFIDVNAAELDSIEGGNKGCDDLTGLTWASCIAFKGLGDYWEGFYNGLTS